MQYPLVSIRNLSYCYSDGTLALNGINLDIFPGERLALVGANGSGKSTLLLHLNGLLLPQQGTITVENYPITCKNLQVIRNNVGLVFQNPDDQLFMPTVWEDLAFGPMNQQLSGQLLDERLEKAMDDVGLDLSCYRERLTNNLSGGEKKRIAIAGVLAMQPKILILDEPSAQLDPNSRRQLIRLLERLNLTQLIATHDLDLALELCNRVIILNQGKIVNDDFTVNSLSNSTLLEKNSLELPLSYSRPYCRINDNNLYADGN